MRFYRPATAKVFSNILFTLFVVFLFIIALEFLLRTTHLFGAKTSWTRPDSRLGYAFISSHEYWYKSENDHPISGRINQFGWRDKERSLTKPRSTFRIAVLGDSFVEALQVEWESTFPALAEDQLQKETGHSVEVMNFGRSGYTQTEEFLVLKEQVLKFSPDLVVLFFFPANDIADVARETAIDSQRPFFGISEGGELVLDTHFSSTKEFAIRSFVSLFRQYSALITLLSDRYLLYRTLIAERQREKDRELPAGSLPGHLSLCTSNPERVFSDNYKLTKKLIAAIAEYCKVRGIDFMLVCCDVYYEPHLEKEYKRVDPTFNPNFFEDDLKKYAQSIKIKYLGLQTIFKQAETESSLSYHWRNDGHWNYQGHILVAKTLADKLKTSIRLEDR